MRMLPWYQREGVRIAAIALAAGLLLGGLIALAVGGPKLSPFGTPKRSAAEAIASDQAATHKPAAKATAKPDAKSAEATDANTASVATATAADVATASPDAADRSDRARAKAGSAPVAAHPRRRTSIRVVSRRRSAGGSPTRRGSTTPTSRPAPQRGSSAP